MKVSFALHKIALTLTEVNFFYGKLTDMISITYTNLQYLSVGSNFAFRRHEYQMLFPSHYSETTMKHCQASPHFWIA